MSDIRSSLQNVPVYMLGKNALPRNYIGDGMNLSYYSGLTLDITEGYCDIDGEYRETAGTSLDLPVRSTGLIYAQKATFSESPVFGFVPAVFPEVDANTVCRWVIDGSDTIANSAVGANGNTIAVANNLTKTGTVTQVDGHIGYAGQGDGSTGYYSSANSTGFPVAASERELDILITPTSVATTQMHVVYGTTTDRFLHINTVGSRLWCSYQDNQTVGDTGFDIEIGKTYLISLCYDGGNLIVYVNGVKIYTLTVALNTALSNIIILSSVSSNKSKGIVHYVELRNKMRTPAQLGAIANKLCLPCSYTGYSASYPTLSTADLASAYHEWKFDETSGTTVADSAGTLNGTVTGTTIVDSQIGLGKARKFNGTSDKIVCGNFQFSSNFTVIFTGILHPASAGYVFLSNISGVSGSLVYVDNTDMTVKIYKDNAVTFTSSGRVPVDIPVFIAVTLNNGYASVYINSGNMDSSGNSSVNTVVSQPLVIGYNNASSYAKMTADYLAYIPRALSQAEIAKIYNSLMKQKCRNIVDDVLPEFSISLGRSRTSSNSVYEANEQYQYGRREKAWGGNRKQFLGWKYFSGSTILYWDSPFGTRKVETYYTWARDANGTNESDTVPLTYDNGVSLWYGIAKVAKPSQRISVVTQLGGVAHFNNVWQTSGYIGCYAEVIED